ncbi:MAG: WYL domain-containing protein [Pseudomonadota bacterium]|nr:WYL domain-containing protein [Pseudomonadota bacterium]
MSGGESPPFRAGGLLELVRHLIGWGDTVEIVAPQRLRRRTVEPLETALAKHG